MCIPRKIQVTSGIFHSILLESIGCIVTICLEDVLNNDDPIEFYTGVPTVPLETISAFACSNTSSLPIAFSPQIT